ncbi:MAG: 2-deoxy-D-gluconate 3-dehydrogenase [Cellulomonas sp. 73-92]|uniref:2-dehydro-3-deoxy-D-gluconate 5-dehydrogenase KduD n=1 Tax=Cellulomonas sp. 73-92 TaxID=1895740 RepID=UPI00092C523B|nr:2-dehydro-3-deoxy-D-gluconate 5-dehydrogenase KduD [Cellulomonas sp. 73-92]OJV80149.1 MAG: 2-deoxy-D-gluconate 3-dehydrogenase [Cellulomonas sp. 73-92]
MILDQFSLDGKVALVTGAGRGLGQGYALALAEAGADVVLLDRTGCPETADRIQGLGRRVHQVVCDLSTATPEQLTGVVAEVVDTFGGLDVLVNNAGIIRRQPALEFSQENWDDVIQINLTAVVFLSQAAARVMARAGHGKIVNIASMLSFQGGINVLSYAAAKSAIAGVTRSLATEWAPLGINVNAIAPGYFATDNTAPLRADADRDAAILGRIPAGRWGTAADLQGTVVYLSSAASDYMHGSIVAVDGGWLSR